MTSDATVREPRDPRQFHALVRDERRLSSAVADHEVRRFDLDAATEVHERTEDLLETLESIAGDESFWNGLRTRAPIAADRARALRDIDPAAFELFLEAAGYESPPPPPARELVDETMAELALALQTPGGGAPPLDALVQARRGLLLTLMRVRRQIADPLLPLAEPSKLSASAHAVGHAARWLIPRAAALAAGAVVESHAPGFGSGVAVYKAAQEILEDGIELGATLLMARVAITGPDVDDTGLEPADLPPPLTAAEVLRNHIALTVDALGTAESRAGSYDQEAADVGIELASARRHIRRIGELLEDHDAFDADQWEPLGRLDAALTEPEFDPALDRWVVDRGLRALREINYLTSERWGPFDRE